MSRDPVSLNPITRSSLTTFSPRADIPQPEPSSSTPTAHPFQTTRILEPFLAEVAPRSRNKLLAILDGLLSGLQKRLGLKQRKIRKLETALEYFQTRFISAKRKLNQLGRNLVKIKNFDELKPDWAHCGDELARKLSLRTSRGPKSDSSPGSQRRKSGTELSAVVDGVSIANVLGSGRESPTGGASRPITMNQFQQAINATRKLKSNSESFKAFEMKATAFRNFQKPAKNRNTLTGFDNSQSCHDNHLRGGALLPNSRNLPSLSNQKNSLGASGGPRPSRSRGLERSELWRQSQTTHVRQMLLDPQSENTNAGLQPQNSSLNRKQNLVWKKPNFENQGQRQHTQHFPCKKLDSLNSLGKKQFGARTEDLNSKNKYPSLKATDLKMFNLGEGIRPSKQQKKKNSQKKAEFPLGQSLETPAARVNPELDLNSYLNFDRNGFESKKMEGVRSEKARVNKNRGFRPKKQGPGSSHQPKHKRGERSGQKSATHLEYTPIEQKLVQIKAKNRQSTGKRAKNKDSIKIVNHTAKTNERRPIRKKKEHFLSSGTLLSNPKSRKALNQIQLPSERNQKYFSKKSERLLEKVKIGGRALNGQKAKQTRISHKKKGNLLSDYVSEFSKLQAHHILLDANLGARIGRNGSQSDMSFHKQMSKIHSAKIINLGHGEARKREKIKKKQRRVKNIKNQGGLKYFLILGYLKLENEIF